NDYYYDLEPKLSNVAGDALDGRINVVPASAPSAERRDVAAPFAESTTRPSVAAASADILSSIMQVALEVTAPNGERGSPKAEQDGLDAPHAAFGISPVVQLLVNS